MRSSVALALIAATLLPAAEPNAAPPYRKALPGYVYQFPRDHFDHPEFRTEWWYYTGNLRAQDGRRFGFELTFFRHGVDRTQHKVPSVWDIKDAWMAHFAVSDIGGDKFHHAERMNRAGAGQAGVDAQRGLIWNGNWRVHWDSNSTQKLFAMAKGFAVDLQFRPQKPPVTHGANGVSQKSAGAGRASHYISQTRLQTSGSIEVDGRKFQVEGLSWMDHEFFTHSLEENQTGWDWFSLQFRDGSELMLYRIRRKDGSVEPYSSGTFVAADGKTRHLSSSDYTLQPGTETWTSPTTKGRYPLRWTLRVPSLGIEAVTTTPLRQQEIIGRSAGSPAYWEGAVDVQGTRAGQPLRGSGYLEMTGYAGAVRMGSD
jgi:predicted secreted hydrolase